MKDTDPHDCSRCRLAQLAGAGRGSFCPMITRSYRAGEAIYEPGREAHYVWLVRDGRVRIGSEERREGALIGTEALRGQRYQSRAVAEGPTVLCGATRDGFIAMLERDPVG